MSGLEIAEAVDTFNNPHSVDAVMRTDKDSEQQESEPDITRSVRDTLVEVEEVVHELHTISRQLSDPFEDLRDVLPSRLRQILRKLLCKEGLEELPIGHRQEARLMILEACGECLANAETVDFLEVELELSSSELEALYRRRLESSAALKLLCIHDASEKWEEESWRLLADMLLRAEVLQISIDTLSLSWLSKLAKAVAASGRGPLPAQKIQIGYSNYGSRKHDIHSSEGTTGRFIQKWTAHVANLIAAFPSLKALEIAIEQFTDEGVSELMGEAVASHQLLETLTIFIFDSMRSDRDYSYDFDESDADEESDGRGSERPAIEESKEPRSPGPVGRLLSRAFLHHRCSTSINSLSVELTTTPSTADLEVLSQVLQMSTRITKFRLSGFERVRSRDLRGILKNLQVNGHMQLQSLELKEYDRGEKEWGFDRDSFAMLVELLKSNSLPALKHLKTSLSWSDESEAFNWAGFYTYLSQMESVSIKREGGYRQAKKEMIAWIQGSKRLQKLDVSKLRDIRWKSIFKCLRENTALRILSVSDEALEDDVAYRELMEMLHVNSTLQEINFSGPTDSSRKAAVREALRGKARQESYLVELRKGLGQAHWQSPKCGRIFLCGSPEAGKTRLTLTMLKVVKKKSLMKRAKEWMLPRTKGVEIHTLKNDDDMQILVWDLAGQDMFRALQQFLFPRLSRASVFIFVFSPFEPSGVLKSELQVAFEEELRKWLRFIASNSAITSLNLPQVMVVISHEDKYMLSKKDLKWRDYVLPRLIHEFEDIIHIHPSQFFIDGHEPQHVKSILEEVDSIFHGLFQGKLFRVPLACSQLSQQLARLRSQRLVEPVIDVDTFFSLCRDIPDLQTFSDNCHEDANKKLLKAVGSYLHDVGTIIDMSLEDEIREKLKSNLIVVDPNWLTHVFLGHFISFGHGKGVEWKGCGDGFLSETDFQQFLFKRFKAMRKKFPKLSSNKVQDLMENLDLLYVTEIEKQKGFKDTRFFIPTLVTNKSEQALDWASHSNESSQGILPVGEICFLGVRLRCKDQERTYLSHAFFSRFQVMIWQKLTEELKEKKPVIKCEFNLISVLVDGLHILVENDEDGDFIDVLIRSTKTKGKAWKFVQKYIVEEVRELCASPKGCPGVELVMHIIRTECVKVSTPCRDRKNQSVSREELKTNLLKSVQELDPSSKDFEKDLYWHTWEPVLTKKLLLGAASEKAVELLPQEDIDGCIKSSTQSLQEKVIRLEDTIKEIDIGAVKNIRPRDVQTHLLQPFQKSKFERSKSVQLVRPIHERVETLMREIHQDLKKDLEKVHAEVLDLKFHMQELIHLRRREEENLSRMYQKLDELMHMGHSVSPKEWPKMPYFTQEDVGVCHRITAVVDIGKPLMLHFKCEERGKPHVVPEQPGYGITVGKKNCEAWRWISQTSVRVIWYLWKAGEHISSGMGPLLPELHTSDGKTSLLTSLSMTELLRKVQLHDGKTPIHTVDTCPPEDVDTCPPEDAWRFLQDFLQMDLNNQITEYFLLHPAQYCDSPGTQTWLCQLCVERGWKEEKLQKL